jgi:acetyl esterase/lipase
VAFIAPIYGGETQGAPVPADAPPLFTAVAQDDLLVKIVEDLHADWTAADRPAELHAFARGAHGFGMVRQGLPSDRWTDLFLAWVEDLDVVRSP